MRRPLATATLLLVLSAAAFVPAAGAQDSELVSCSFSPSELTLRPGQSATYELNSVPAIADANPSVIVRDLITLDGSELPFDIEEVGDRIGVQSGEVTTVTYESIVEIIQPIVGESVSSGVSSGVFVWSLGNIVVVGEEAERFEALCSIPITLTSEPDPTTTTVAPELEPGPSPNPEPATPRHTG